MIKFLKPNTIPLPWGWDKGVGETITRATSRSPVRRDEANIANLVSNN